MGAGKESGADLCKSLELVLVDKLVKTNCGVIMAAVRVITRFRIKEITVLGLHSDLLSTHHCVGQMELHCYL